jgi:hypothetical protein
MMAMIVTRPGDQQIAEDDLVLRQAYYDQDNLVAQALREIVDDLTLFADESHSVAVLGFDATRYQSLRRDARVAAGDVHRSLTRWLSSR